MTRLPLLVIALLAVVLAGCGSTSHHVGKAAYEQRMKGIVRPAQIETFKMRLALEQVQSPLIAKRQLATVETTLRSAAASLAAIDPPSDVAAQHARLIRAYRGLAQSFQRTLGPETKKRTTDTLRVRAGEFARSASIKEVGVALQAIIAKGYDIGLGNTP